ncbi:MAG TPA: gluconate 2-dehydrogenase subunit 3 family protein [Pyrinomonadaceae bacterium]|nr:gluconate 2-dehydrogenase subunit 3 family protein [Pyrinomonadaceae bacterium]
MNETFEQIGQELSRRRFVKIIRDSALILILPRTLGCSGRRSGERSSTSTYQLRFLTQGEAEIVEAVTARIIPSDEQPGAREARVVDFIDHMLATTYVAQQRAYREGLRELDQLSRRRFGRQFVAVAEKEQDELLSGMERREIREWKEAGDFFATIRLHTIEGMFSAPKYYGNADRLGWQLLDV